LEEVSVSPFELQKADEIFITNTIVGIQPVTKYRKKEYQNNLAKDLIVKLNTLIRFS
jgi:branched-chain amino acid aminotransferase